MKKLTQILLMALAVFATHSLSRAQDEPVWKYIGSTTNKQTGEITIFHARDCYRFTDAESAKYPKLAVRQQTGETPPTKEAVDEYDCKRRASRIRIWLYKDGTEQKEKNFDWVDVVPGSVGEVLLNYACRERKEKN
jgi:nucleotide-binding universal stress UspA family protein